VQPDPSPEHGHSPAEPDRLGELDTIADRPLADQVEVYQRLHRELQEALGDIDTA
jgi:hypothetical protein